jgi:hypothetical protein
MGVSRGRGVGSAGRSTRGMKTLKIVPLPTSL